MSNELISNEKSQPASLDVTLLLRAKHADLWAAAKTLGGQSALGRALGVSPSVIGSWVNLQAWPSAEKAEKVEAKLFELTGKTIEELFPEALRKTDLLSGAKSVELHTRYVEKHGICLNAAEDGLSIDAKETIEKVLKTLTYREREVLKLRYGLVDGMNFTLDEVAHVYKCTRERIRQIELRAIRKLQNPSRADVLEQLLPEGGEVVDERWAGQSRYVEPLHGWKKRKMP